jgi:hypothetical protein
VNQGAQRAWVGLEPTAPFGVGEDDAEAARPDLVKQAVEAGDRVPRRLDQQILPSLAVAREPQFLV